MRVHLVCKGVVQEKNVHIKNEERGLEVGAVTRRLENSA